VTASEKFVRRSTKYRSSLTMAPQLPSMIKSHSSSKLVMLPSVERSSSGSKCSIQKMSKGTTSFGSCRDRRPEWCGPLDSAPSTRVPSEASSRSASREASRAASREASRAASKTSSCAGSRPSSPSSSSKLEPFPQCSLSYTRSVPLLPLATLNKTLLPSLTTAAVAQLSDTVCTLAASSKPPTMKKMPDVVQTRRKLEQACHAADIETAKICYLRDAGVLSQPLSSGELPLHYSVKKQHFAFVEFLKQYGVDINAKDEEGRTVLHVAAANNDDEAICRLVELGVKRKLQDHKGQTALHAAAAAGHTRAVELLLELAADINAKDKAGWTAVSHAEFNDHFDLADRLVGLGGSDPHGMRNDTRRTARRQKGQLTDEIGDHA